MISAVSRTQRSARNAGISVLGQIVLVVLGFVTRTVFLQQLGVELLGVQSLLLSLVAIVSVADAGVSWALMYSLYQPLEAGDVRNVAAVMDQARRWYRWIASGTALIGLGALPALDRFVKLEEPVAHLHVYYLVLLAGVVVQYPLYPRVLLLEADQQAYWTRLVATGLNVLRSAAQVAVLIIWQDFLSFLVIHAITGVITYAIVFWRVGQRFPYLSEAEPLSRAQRREIGRSVRAMLVYRLAGLILTNAQPILISVLLGTLILGYYSNYLMLIGAAVMVSDVAFAALTPSIGNLVASGDRQGTRLVFDEVHLLALGLYGTASVAMLLTLDDLLRLWLGGEFVLSSPVLVAAVAYFYLVGVVTPVTNFRSATGMFREARYVLVATAGCNIGLAIVMADPWGLPGVLFAAVLARLLTNVWIEPVLLFRKYVTGGLWPYVRTHLLGLLVLSTSYIVLEVLATRLGGEGWPTLVAAGAAAIALVPALFAVVFGRGEAWSHIHRRVRSLVTSA